MLMQSLKLGEYFHVLLIYKTDDVLSKGGCLGREGETFRFRGLLTCLSSRCLSALHTPASSLGLMIFPVPQPASHH